MSKYAQINDGIVQNIILLEDESIISKFSEGYEFFIKIDGIDPEPQVGGQYDGQDFLPPKDLSAQDQVLNAIKNYQSLAKGLMAEIYTENKLAGLTTEQSDKIFDEFGDVVLRINEGAFPTALFRLEQKIPEGFVTQELLDSWIVRLKGYM